MSEGRCICGFFAGVTEAAALAAAEWMGRGDALAAGDAARRAMAAELERIPLRGRIVAGRRGSPSSNVLPIGGEVGSESGPWAAAAPGGGWQSADADVWDMVVDPLQAPNSLARGDYGALAMVAAGPPGSLMAVPEMYMQKLVVPAAAAGAIDLDALVGDNIRAVASAVGRQPEELVVVVLDRPRHEELIAHIKATGARVRLVTDGDVSAGIAVAAADEEVDMCIGIGGSTEGILTAAALRCLGGDMQARFWPVSRHQVDMLRTAGIEDVEVRLAAGDMAGDGVLFSGTAVTGGRFLRAVHRRQDGLHTETMVMCTRCHAIRKLHTIHRSASGGPPVALKS